ncbi:MAG: TusE/DsrC/DsvC family sulfur relay protein [Acidimicrobiia bacterium]|nr:TusE/DsrC/DsvC family sulfur relay protein [Acidimicrobiia bacterium]NNF10531.1 TusE/DsrC/DsvC family sulfur relay protein [Acidimicrobiia bacterium]NNL47033.1 TusE/DsrC/DsvC family sulfur relay protein [Acidimicrobiia bacterium]NNL69750.1 TusE/DsrC/DsvC family sulfur relay protein [Acidimicrobiia bacterium]
MATETLAGTTVEVDDEGFFVDPSNWTEDMAPELASHVGVDELTEDHWTVIKFCRTDFAAKGESPTLRRVSTEAGVPTKQLFQLFPKKPAKKMSYVAGVPKPKGCV